MARTQFTMAQTSGSLVSIKEEVGLYAAPSTAAALTGSDLQDVVGALAAAVQRIHGKAGNEVFNQQPGTFDTSIFDVNSAGAVTIDAGAASSISTSVGALDIDAAGALTIDSATSIAIGAAADKPIDIDSTTLDIDASGAVTIDVTGAGISIDAAGASNLTTSTGDLDISSAAELDLDGATVALNSGGVMGITAVGALNIESAAYDVDASGVVGIDSAAAMTLGGVSITATAAGGDASLISSTAKVILSGASAADSVHIRSDATFDGAVVIAGNLDVNGTVSTIDTVNMTVKDRLVGLNYDGGAEQALADIGFVFGNSGGPQKAFLWDNSETEFALVNTNNTATDSVITPASYAPLQVGALKATGLSGSGLTNNRVVIVGTNGALEDDGNFTFDGSDLALGNNIGLQFGNVGRKIESDGNNLSIESNGFLALDVASNERISLKAAGTSFGAISKHSGGHLILSSAAGKELYFDANVGSVSFRQGGAEFLSVKNVASDAVLQPAISGKDIIFKEDGGNEIARFDSSAESLLLSAANKIQFGDSGTYVHQSTNGQLDAIADVKAMITAPITEIQSSTSIQLDSPIVGLEDDGVVLQFGANADVTLTHIHDAALRLNGQLEIQFGSANEAISSNGTKLELKSGGQSFTLPTAAVAGQYLRSDGGGNLTFQSVSATKSVRIMSASHLAGAPVSLATADIQAGLQNVNMNLAEVQGSDLDVFVNGQLLLSGSEAQRAGGARDYAVATSSTLKFAFALELDDIVQAITRG
jgi:hypothetical protein|tara:strand:+ start:3022 stop:5313 length:2292 start_codon:yes stop_codon:yes gene_type:complete